MARYMNTKTGAVIETACVIQGDNWEPVKNQGKDTKKKSNKKSE